MSGRWARIAPMLNWDCGLKPYLCLGFLTSWQPPDSFQGGSGFQQECSSQQGGSCPASYDQALKPCSITPATQKPGQIQAGRAQKAHLSMGGTWNNCVAILKPPVPHTWTHGVVFSVVSLAPLCPPPTSLDSLQGSQAGAFEHTRQMSHPSSYPSNVFPLNVPPEI